MGRPTTPTKLKLLRGETRPSRLNRAEPRPRPGGPKVPIDLGPVARTVWRRVIREMGATGVITAVDADTLRLYCEAVARYLFAEKMLVESGPLIRAGGRGARSGELVKNPLHQVVRDNAVLVRMMGRELGLTPAARASLHGNQEPERDPFAAFLDGVG
ncbi:MAG: phage terminase small subunit P27 family [Candidatus Limnocylindrales bacterium]